MRNCSDPVLIGGERVGENIGDEELPLFVKLICHAKNQSNHKRNRRESDNEVIDEI